MKIEINDEILNVLKDKNNKFKNVEEYINDILRQVTERISKEKNVYTKEEEDKIKEKLTKLGYLD